MKLPYALLGLTIFVFITVMATIHVTPSAGYFKSEALPNPTCPNDAPTAAADSYTVHGSFETPVESPVTGVLKNDSDPENEALHCNFQNVQTPIGLATIYNNGKAAFNPNYGQTGDATINYSACDPCNTCSQASVTFHVVNQTPIAGSDEYTVRGDSFETPLETPNGVLKNDSDPDGDPLTLYYASNNYPQGSATVYANGKAAFVRNPGYSNYEGSFSFNIHCAITWDVARRERSRSFWFPR